MLNAEKFKDEFYDFNGEFVMRNADIVFSRETGRKRLENLGDFFNWLLSEYKEQILDEAEREYLSAVCRPYKVVTICKKNTGSGESQWLEICIDKGILGGYEYIHLPYFKANTMYQGMKPKKEYTPQELGITCKNNPNGEIKHD